MSNSLKARRTESEDEYKSYKNIFEKLKKKSKQLYYIDQMHKYQQNSKMKWQIIKEITGCAVAVCNNRHTL